MTLRTDELAHAPGAEAAGLVGKPRLWGAMAYLVLCLPSAVVFGLAPLVLMMGGIATTVVWVGIPVLMFTTSLWRGFASLERGWMRVTMGVLIPSPYRPRANTTMFRRWLARLRDPATWRDLTYLVLRMPLALLEFCLTVVLWAYSLAMVGLPIYAPLLKPADRVNLPDLSWHMVVVSTVRQSLPYAGVGLVFLFLTILISPRIAQVQVALAKALLGPTKAARLAVKADHLQASRARGVDAAEAERRRIERDLHDGAQQRLVAVAMTLGRAKNKLADDPDSARLLIDEAHADAKQAVAELRDLARGIYPAVLGDRGLDAALSALAARCPVPVRVDVDTTPRPPAAVESTAYFIVAETLTNVAKHATATSVGVIVRRTGNTVTVQVVDNGQGGAAMRAGGGLAGLADRAATIDGVMSVTSPPGGPTVITAELPCEW